MRWGQKSLAVGIVLLYLGVAVVLVGLAYRRIRPDLGTTDKIEREKEFGVIVGIALTADAAFVGILVSFFTLSAQMRFSKDLADKNEEVLKRVEDHKKALSGQIETLKGDINLQNDFLNKTLDAKSAAYNKLFVATDVSYRALQDLAKGEFDIGKVEEAEKMLEEGSALAANLDDPDREIVMRILQTAYNVRDSAEKLKSKGTQLKVERESIWNQYASTLGSDINLLRDRSPFYNKKFTR